MSRGKYSIGRALGVWLLVTTGVLATWSTVAGAAFSLAAPAVWHGTFEDLLVAVASAALVACAGWLWLVTSATVLDVVRGRVPSAAPRGLTRRLVLAACGAAVVAGVGSPALAGQGDQSLGGLPMPDRAVAGSTVRAGSPPAPEPAPVTVARPTRRRTPPPPGLAAPVTVRPGDSLWSIAAAGLGHDADVTAIDAAWRELYAANREAIGTDPDLIVPGLDLQPGTDR